MKEAITAETVSTLLREQFSDWCELPIRAVSESGWDNRTFHLGDEMVVRLPSDPAYAVHVAIEHRWLPVLAPYLPLRIPNLVGRGAPSAAFPILWSIYDWIPGERANAERIVDTKDFAKSLANFLLALQAIESHGGPSPSSHNFHRGGALSIYDAQVLHAITWLEPKIDTERAQQLWERAIATTWERAPVWVHGDVSCGNLLVQDGALCAVIDFGQLAVGDPACDYAIAWTFFDRESRNAFRDALHVDEETWIRARAWALWKALIIASDIVQTNAVEFANPWRVLEAALSGV